MGLLYQCFLPIYEVIVTLRSIYTILFLLFATPAFSLPTLTIGSASREDSTITMTLTLTEAINAGITALKTDILFDSDVFEPNLPGSSTSIAGKNFKATYNKDGILTVIIYDGANTLSDGEIAKLLFSVKPQTNPASSEVSVVNQSASDSNSTPIPLNGSSYVVPQLLITPDITPDTFTFIPQTNTLRGVYIQSAPVVINGINSAAPISISNGEFSVNGGVTWRSPSETGISITNGQSIIIRHISSSEFNTTTTTTISINGITATFSSTTAARISGDITGRGTAPQLSDALLVLQAVVGANRLTAEQYRYADMNSDGRVDVGDAILVLSKVVGL